jgi:hypothetical protein
MNLKSTLYLFAAFIGLAGGYFLWQRGAPANTSGEEKKPLPPESATTRNLIEPKLGDAVKVVCKRGGEPEWVFEKDAQADASGKTNWRMTAPIQTVVNFYDVNRIAQQLGSLQYDLSYQPGQPGSITLQQAGLAPPEWTITVTDANQVSATVEIGRPASDTETYVRLAGKDAVVVARTNLKSLVKERAVEYRDLQLWNFNQEQVVRVEITDRSNAAAPVSYAFTKDGSKWVMTSPAAAKATGKVDELIRTMKNLRAAKWEDNRREKFEVYGLAAPAWSIRATVEEKVKTEGGETKEAGSEEESGSDPPPAETTQQTVYELFVSDRSPIGDETKAYIRGGDEPFVGTVAKTIADKFKPVMADWREMRVTQSNVNEATRIELSVPDGKAVLVKDLGAWAFEEDRRPAEDATVRALLNTIQNLTAASFTDGEKPDLAATGLAQPRAEIRLTIPGIESVERIAVGGYSDPASKHFVYVRLNEATSIAKVRASSVEPLLQGLRSYRDRTLVDVHADRMREIAIATRGAESSAVRSITLRRADGAWTLSAPVSAAVRPDRVEQLVTSLGTLRADAIVADEGALTAYGLDAPAASVTLVFAPPSDGEEAPPQTLKLVVTEHDGKYYAKRADQPAIYQVSGDFFKQLTQEFRTADVLSFDDAKVKAFSIRSGEQTHRFVKKDDRWLYGPEPDLALDATKVKNLLLQLKDLKTERYVRDGAADLAEFGLQPAHHEVKVELEEGAGPTLLVSQKTATGPDKGLFAAVAGRDGVFLVTSETAGRFQVSLAELEKAR